MATSRHLPKYDLSCPVCAPTRILPFRAPEQAASELARLVRAHLQPKQLPHGIVTLLVWIAERAHAIPNVLTFVKALDLGPPTTIISWCQRANVPTLKTVLIAYRLAILAALCARWPDVTENDLALSLRFGSPQGLSRHMRQQRGFTYRGWTQWRTSVSMLTEFPRVAALLDHPGWRKLDKLRTPSIVEPAPKAIVADSRYAYRVLSRAERALDL